MFGGTEDSILLFFALVSLFYELSVIVFSYMFAGVAVLAGTPRVSSFVKLLFILPNINCIIHIIISSIHILVVLLSNLLFVWPAEINTMTIGIVIEL